MLVIGLGDSRAYLLPWTGVPLGPVTWAASGPLAPWMMMNSTVSPSPTLRRNLRGLFLMMAVYGGMREGGGEREKERERKVKGDGRKEWSVMHMGRFNGIHCMSQQHEALMTYIMTAFINSDARERSCSMLCWWGLTSLKQLSRAPPSFFSWHHMVFSTCFNL